MERPDFLTEKAKDCEDSLEEVIFEGHDTGWDGRELPVTLIFYKTTKTMDLHRQTGTQFQEHWEEAKKVLAQRGLKVDENDQAMVGCTGLYQKVIRV
jgi:hypothetical protein